MVLLGDAAHATTPFVGQGANQAIMDGWSLADKLLKSARGDLTSVEAALAAYERVRKPETERVMKMSAMIGAVETCSWPWSTIRNCFYGGGNLIIKGLKEKIKPKV